MRIRIRIEDADSDPGGITMLKKRQQSAENLKEKIKNLPVPVYLNLRFT